MKGGVLPWRRLTLDVMGVIGFLAGMRCLMHGHGSGDVLALASLLGPARLLMFRV